VWLPIFLLAVGLAACGPVRQGVPDPTADSTPNRLDTASITPTTPAMTGPARLECLDHPAIDVWETRLKTEQRWRVATESSVARAEPYLVRVRAIFAEQGLPPGLALLPVIESGFRTNARGPGGSVGLWQFQVPTARRFGLVVSRKRDDRLDPEHSTRAAATYLRMLYERYGDWPLALAAYNAGEGRVDRALARRPGATVWDLVECRALPEASHDYVSRFLAVTRVVDDSPCPPTPTASAL
jgi:transglycosylase-like protein with SLT domain